ncbi:MAG: hypothetical protein IJH38_04355 [Clostridia bacterium]|nr:hypothetical protein [Clostridia bacterium]
MSQTKRLTASEREALLRMNMAADILMRDIHELDQRAKLVPYARRDLAMLAAVAKRLLTGFRDTIPEEQLRTYLNALSAASYVVGIKRPGAPTRNEKDYGMWLPYEVLNALLAGCHDHCMMCDLDKAGRRACPLKKALDIIPNDSEDRPDGDCPYYTLL